MENKGDLSLGMFQVSKVVRSSVCRQVCREPHARQILVNTRAPKLSCESGEVTSGQMTLSILL